MNTGRQIIEQIDDWVNELAAPLMPPRLVTIKEDDLPLLCFNQHIPHAVMVGKLVRAVSGIHGALLLAEAGYVTECASILRIVSDFCTEIYAIGEALNRGGDLPCAVKEFVDQYFLPKRRTVKEYIEAERVRYVSREELMKADVKKAEGTIINGEQFRDVHKFLNMML